MIKPQLLSSFICLAIFFFSTLNVSAQASWNFAAPTDGSGNAGAETGKGICTDASGNVYTIGVFTGTSDFDLNSTTTNTAIGSAIDGYVASYDKNGVFRWKVIISGPGNDFGSPSGGICTNGTYVWVVGTVNMSGGSVDLVNAALSSTVTVTGSAGNGTDAIVAKLSCSNGGIQWGTAYGGTGADNGQGICVDPNGCCYTIGAYTNTYTLNGITAPTTTGGAGSDLYVAKFSTSGTLLHFASGGASGVGDMGVDGGGLCYVPGATPAIVAAGSFGAGTATYGSFSGITSSGANDAVLLELDTTLNITNALGMGTAGTDELLGATYDPYSGQVYVCGLFGGATGGSITLPGTSALTSAGVGDAVIASYSPSSNVFTWAKSAGGSANDQATAITSDGQGGILVTGLSASAPSTFGSLTMSSGGADDIFAVRYNTGGTPVWLLSAGGTGGDDGRGIASYVQSSPYVQNLYVTGNFQNTATFGTQPSLVADGGNDFFVARINDLSVPLSATQSQVNLTCNGVCTGSATVVASGGTSPYTYSWSPAGGSGATASSLCATNYTVTITDAASVSITKTFNVTQPPAIITTPVAQTNVSCFGGSNGAAQLTASGGTGTLTYNWTPGNPTGDGTASVTGLTAQTWTCTVTDANSCTATRTFVVTQPPAMAVSPASQTNVSCFGGSNGAASVSVSGGTPGYSYNWTPGNPTGDGTATVTGLTAQTYTCTVTDANGCTATRTFAITQPTAPVSGTTVVTNISCFGGSNGSINLTPSGGTPGYTFNWLPSGPTTEDRTGLTAGTYSVQITDANGCTGTVTATTTQPAAAVSGTTVVTNISCFGGSNGSINLTPSGGTPGYTFNWLPSGPTTEDRTGLTAGTYSVQITDANGCTGTVTATTTQPAAAVSGTTVVTNISCFGGSNGSINLTPSGGTPGYTFNWLPSGPTTEDRTGLTAGTYSVQITDANGCTGTVTATTTQPAAAVSGTTVVTNISCFGGSNGSINLTPSGGTPGYTFNWLPSGPTTEDRTGLTAGTYSVQITDANGCTGTVTATTTQPAAAVSGTTVVTNISCFGGSNGSINLTPSGGTPGYTFNWLPSGPTTEDRTGLTAGTYSVQITDANGCTGTVTATTTQPAAAVSGTTVVTNISCFGGSNGSINLTPSGGTPGYTFNWLPSGPTTEDRTGLTAGTYSVQITDANGCTGTVNATVTQPASSVSGTKVVTNVSCFGGSNGSINLTPSGGSGGYTFNWLPSGPTTEDRTGLTAGTYTVQITDVNGCTGTVNATVTQPTTPVSGTTVVTNVACFGGSSGSINLTPSGGSGGYSFNWLPSGPTTEDRTGLTAGTYSVQITDVNGCTGTVTATTTQPTAISTATASQTNIPCNGGSNGSASVTPSGGTPGYTYSWAPSGGTGASATGLAAGTYTVTVTDANSCTATRVYTITQATAINTASGSQTNISCNGGSNGSASITPSGGTPGYSYSWAPSGGTSATATGLAAGTYTVTVTDANSCTATRVYTITQPTAMNTATGSQTNISCNGGSNGSASVTPSGGTPGYTYSWAPSGGTGASATGLAAGTYTVTVTDANSCTATRVYTITQATAINTASGSQTNISCNGGSNGSASITPSGGTPGYSYSWAPSGGTSATATGLAAGTYTVTVTDANSCTATRVYTITQPTAMNTATGSQTNISCNGGSNGSASVTPSGGTPGYTYSWAPSGGTGASATGLAAGTYTVTVTDANSCTATRVYTITEPVAITATTSQTNVSCNGGSNASASVTTSGGSGGYTYSWAPSGGTAATASGLTAGSYTCTITDENTCSTTKEFTITEPTAITATTSQTNVSCNGGSNASASVTASGGTGDYTYSWAPSGGTAATASGLTAGSYTCTITDENTCSITKEFTITEPTAITATTSQTNVSCNGGSNASASVTASGGTGAYTYSWAPSGGTAATASGLAAGSYTCTITDENTCSITKEFTITEPTAITATTSQTNVSCNGGSNASASVTASGGTGDYTYSWAPSGGTAATASGLTAGSYTCTITDENTCSITKEFTITEPTAITATTSQTNAGCYGTNTGSATVTASDGTPGYTYSWSPSGGTAATASGLAAGDYSCTITDANGCFTTKEFTITESAAITATASQTNVTCTGGSTGTATVEASGGTGAKTYSWSPSGGTEATATDLAAGSYTCTITDENLCSIIKTFIITEPVSIPGSNSYLLPTSNQTVVKNAGGSNFVEGTCELVSSVVGSGASAVSGMVTNKVWIEATVPTDNGYPFVQRHYEITPAINAEDATGTVTLYFTQTEFDNFNAHAGSTLKLPINGGDNAGKANLRIGKYSGVSGDGTGLPASYSGTTMVIDPDDNNIVWNAASAAWEVTFPVDGFSGLIVQTNTLILPVNWISFNVKKVNQSVLLNWSTAAEHETKDFSIQHSTDGLHWQTVGIRAASGNSNSLHSYTYIDNNTVEGYNYYRIIQTDVDGKTSFSEMRVVKFSGDLPPFTILGNPVGNGTLQVHIHQATNLSLYEISGKLLWKRQFAPGLQSIDVSRYAQGIYLLKANATAQKIFIE